MKQFIKYFFVPALMLVSCGDDPSDDIDRHDGFELVIPEESETKIDAWKEIALEQGIISADLKQYVPAICVYQGDSIPVEIRLKGDWTDHLENDLPSFRVKFPKGNTFRGMKTFSIQDPITRNYAHEWFMHRLFEREKMLTTTYDFAPILINGEGGTFAVEEHFESRLLTSRGRVPGPILKMDETGLWQARLHENKIEANYPIFLSALIKPFKKSKILEDEKFKKQFEMASSLVNIYKTNEFKASDLFDMLNSGMYFAMLELGYVNHSIIWHNQRFYYDPIAAKLEFIGFDMNPAHEEAGDTLIRVRKEFAKGKTSPGWNLMWPFLVDEKFRYCYTFFLKQFSNEKYLDDFEKDIADELELSVELLRANDFSYGFDLSFYRNRAALIRENLKVLDEEWDQFLKRNDLDTYSYRKKYLPLGDDPILSEVSLKAYLDEKKTNYDLVLENYHREEIIILGYSSRLNEKTYIPIRDELRLAAFEFEAERTELKLEVNAGKVFYRTLSSDSVYSVEIMPWRAPKLSHPRLKLAEKFDFDNPVFRMWEDTIVFEGEVTVDEIILVPDTVPVIVMPGTRMTFTEDGGLILSYWFTAKGTKDSTVQLVFDKKSHGLLTSNSGFFNLSWTTISGGGELDYKGWETKSMITASNTWLAFEDVKFDGVDADNAFHAIRCRGYLRQTSVSNCEQDGLKLDYSDLELQKVRLSNISGVGIRSKGSFLKTDKCSAKNLGTLIEASESSNLVAKEFEKKENVGPCQILDGSIYTSDEKGFYPAVKEN